jgi:hypothetical protein
MGNGWLCQQVGLTGIDRRMAEATLVAKDVEDRYCTERTSQHAYEY